MAAGKISGRFGAPDPRGHHGTGEAGALFVGPVYESNGTVGLRVGFLEHTQDFESG